MVRAEPPIFSRCILLKKTAYISASIQDIKNLVGKFEAIHVRNMHANFQVSSFTGMAGKWGDRQTDIPFLAPTIMNANHNDFSKLCSLEG